MTIKLENNLLTAVIDTFGAELQSITSKTNGREYLWHGDKRFWGRRSPVLFPLVGQVWEGRYSMDGNEYHLGQHGFARDREFNVMEDAPEDEAWFYLESDEESLRMYPRRFRLEIGYKLYEARLEVVWRVKNTDDKTMHFHIGAHPAFMIPDFRSSDEIRGYLNFDRKDLTTQLLSDQGAVAEGEATVHLDGDGMLPLTADTFSTFKTIILANNQVHRVSLLDREHAPVLSVLFRAPVVGIWAPSSDAPFVCIEPWWGRADHEGYNSEFADREYTNTLPSGDTFTASYMIIFDSI